jgi:two-component system CheB/CheR fusion protein
VNDNAPIQPTNPALESEKFDGFVVCIGASAGGLDALERFFSACPVDSGAAFVVVQHLSPDHKSMMNTLLSRHTGMPVIMVEEDMPLRSNCLFLIPPGSLMHVSPGHLHLKPKKSNEFTLPIDIFFKSLAEVYGPRAVGIVLSGTGSDGTRGVGAISAAGGFLMAQDPESSKFDGMPRSAIGTGLMSAVLPPDELAARLRAYLLNEPFAEAVPSIAVTPHSALSNDEAFLEILQRLYQLGGIDFSDYKPATILRRLERRMQVRHSADLQQYLTLLEQDRDEMLILRNEMLISVTSFFRDPEAFGELASRVIDPLVAAFDTGETIRVWVAGAATGEEAYSIAMLFLEAFERQKRWPILKIFATDVDHQAIERASVGTYRETIAAEISPERLNRFFIHKAGAYTVKTELRQCIVFARQNLLSDPPFTKMDLAVCRNTLIYFKPHAQERVLHALLYALNQGGTLFLGSSESIAMMTNALTVVNAKHKLFHRTADRILPLMETRSKTPTGRRHIAAPAERSKIAIQVPSVNAADVGIATLVAQYAPPAIVFNETHEAVHLFGDVNPFIQAKSGSASLVVSRLLLDALVPVASALLHKTIKDQSSLQSEPVEVVLRNGETKLVRLSAHHLRNDGVERLCMICFVTEERSEKWVRAPLDVGAETMSRMNMLERELTATRESLQTTIEELETSNEELQATNEELMASNEELQSSNEELQSVNEELNTVNAEYQEKMLLLGKVNADLESMGRAVAVATIFVDPDLQITRFSPDAANVFKLRDTDLGRPLDDIAHILAYPALMDDLRATMQSGLSSEREVSTQDAGKIMFVRMIPYAIPSSTGRGAVLSIVDVSAYHDVRRLQSVLDCLPEHVAVLDSDGTITMVNAAWRRFAHANGDADLALSGPGSNYLRACINDSGVESSDAANRGLRAVLDGTLPSFSMEYPCHSPNEERWFVMNVAPIPGPKFGAVVSHFNVTSWFARSNQ